MLIMQIKQKQKANIDMDKPIQKLDTHGFVVLTQKNFSSVVKKDELWVVVFSATWCGPCQKLKKELSKINKSGIDLGVVDKDADGALYEKYNKIYLKEFRKNSKLKNKGMGLPAMWIMYKGKAIHVDFQKVSDDGYVKHDFSDEKTFLMGETGWRKLILDIKKQM
ncbi:hypothetical protein COU37_00220 [Candidatus Micrarchaeota archaeon CG10_big_fil_rev_8_21_14_0_10_45_29]|nr:MAG: hypothetical protein COU37_00220 [Candidatus Micrarchaeota archaeon CG10_big_fil_rev_8_21_14_0_10_45_29]